MRRSSTVRNRTGKAGTTCGEGSGTSRGTGPRGGSFSSSPCRPSWPLLLLAFSFPRSSPLSLFFTAAIGFAFVIQNAPANSLLQSLVPDHLRGRGLAIYVSLFPGLVRVGRLLRGGVG